MEDIREVSDAQLVTMIARYNEVALAETYRRHGGAVFGLARRVLTVRPRPKTSLRRSSFGYGINRSASTRPRELAQLAPHPEPRARGRDYSFAHGATPTRDQRRAQGRARRLRHATRGVGRRVGRGREEGTRELPPEERRAIELAYFEGYTYIKVAEILNEPEGTVKSRIRNGMRRMRATLVESGIEGADR